MTGRFHWKRVGVRTSLAHAGLRAEGASDPMAVRGSHPGKLRRCLRTDREVGSCCEYSGKEGEMRSNKNCRNPEIAGSQIAREENQFGSSIQWIMAAGRHPGIMMKEM